jgi:hypothetical protein
MYWVLAIALGAATIVLPRAARLNDYAQGGFLTPEAYAMVFGILVAVLIMALRDPAYDRRWTIVIALAPLVHTSIRILQSGAGNLWPTAIFLDLMLGFAPAFLGLWLARKIRSHQHGTLLLVAVSTVLAIRPAEAQAQRRTAESTFEFRSNTGDCPTTLTTNSRFLFLPEGIEGTGTVLRETVSIIQCLTAEGKDANLVLEAWPAAGPATTRALFTIRLPGERGEVDGPWYRVLQGGCCGTWDLWRYHSLRNGRELFTASRPPVFLKFPDDGQRILSVHDSYSATSSRDTDADSTVIAVLQYGDGVRPSHAAVVRIVTGGYWTAAQLFLKGPNIRSDSSAHRFGRDRAERPVDLSGVSVVLVLESVFDMDRPPLQIEIPIENDRLVLENARTSPGVTLALRALERP